MYPDPVALEALVRSPQRLASVQRSGLLDSPPEEPFDVLTRLAVLLLKAPASFVSIVDEQRDFYKSQAGFPPELAAARELPGRTFCHFTLGDCVPLVIEDTHSSPVWQAVPTVQTLGVRAYVGVPLRLDDQNVGSFCVIDTEPRQWSGAELEVIEQLGKSVSRELHLRAAAQRAADEADRMRRLVVDKEKLVAVVAHDLRNPIQVVALSASVLQRSTLPGHAELAQRMLNATSSMRVLVDDLLADNAIAPNTSLRLEQVSASLLMRDALDTMSPIATRSGISLSLGNLAEGSVRVDYAQILRVFSNLIGNAIKYCGAGSKVELSARVDGSDMLLRVEDNGCGFSVEHKARAFEAGWQGPEGLARGDGAGLGLSIVRTLVEKNGGTVTLDSQLGKGSLLTVRLPLAQSESGGSEARDQG